MFPFFTPEDTYISHSLRYGLFFVADETELVLSLMAYMFTAGVKLMGYPRKKLQSSKGGKLQNSLTKRPRSEPQLVGHVDQETQICPEEHKEDTDKSSL